jgi:hypothetical protein
MGHFFFLSKTQENCAFFVALFPRMARHQCSVVAVFGPEWVNVVCRLKTINSCVLNRPSTPDASLLGRDVSPTIHALLFLKKQI